MDAIVPRVTVAVRGVVALVRRGPQGRPVAPVRSAAVAEVARGPPGGRGEGGGRGAVPAGPVVGSPPARGGDSRQLGAFAGLAAPEVRLVQQEGVRELAEADEQRRDPGEQHEGLLVAPAQAPEEGQHRPVVVQQQEAGGRRAAARGRAAAGVRGGQRLDLPAATGARAAPEGHRGRRVPGRQGAVLLAQGRLPPGPAARRLAPPVYRHGPGPRRPQRRIERSGGSRGRPGQSAPRQAPAAASEQGPRLESECWPPRRVSPPPWHRRGPRAPGAAAPIGRRADGGQRPALALSRRRSSALRPGAGGRARRSPLLRAGRGRRRSGRRASAGRLGALRTAVRAVRAASPAPRRPGCIYPTSAPSGSRELGSQPAAAAALSSSASRPPSSFSRSPPPPRPRPAPSPPAEVEVTAAPAAPGSWARAPPPAGKRRATGSAGGGRGKRDTPGPPIPRVPCRPPPAPGGAGEEKARSSWRGWTGDPSGVGVRPELMNGVVFAARLSPPRDAPTHPACAWSR